MKAFDTAARKKVTARNAVRSEDGGFKFPLLFTGTRLNSDGSLDFSNVPTVLREKRFLFGPAFSKTEHMLNYAWATSQIGAMVLRLDQITTGIVHLLSQVSDNLKMRQAHQVQAIVSAKHTQEELYDLTSINGRLMANTAYLFGSSTFKNSRAQRLHRADANDGVEKGYYVKGGIAEVMMPLHAPLMAAGGEFIKQLKSQNFMYIPGPINARTREIIRQSGIKVDISSKNLEIPDGASIEVLKAQEIGSGFACSYEAFDGNGKILDCQELKRKEDAGERIDPAIKFGFFVSNSNSIPSPIGLVVSPEGDILPEDLTMDLLRIDVLRKVGFNDRPTLMNATLYEGTERFKRDEQHTINSGNAHEGLFKVMADLSEYGFDPLALTIPYENLAVSSFKTLSARLRGPDRLAPLLYLNLAAQAAHAMTVIEGRPAPEWYYGEASPILNGDEGRPLRYRLPIPLEINALNAMADFLGLQHAQKVEIFENFDVEKHHALYENQLPMPTMTSAAHVAGILSIAIMSAEQVIIKKLISEAVQSENCMEFRALRNIFDAIHSEDSEKHLHEILVHARNIEPERLGRSEPESATLLQAVRDKLQLSELVDFVANDLLGMEVLSIEKFESLDHRIKCGIDSLSAIDSVFQVTPGVQTRCFGSSGIGAVTNAIINSLLPSLKFKNDLYICPDLLQVGAIYGKEIANCGRCMEHDIENPNRSTENIRKAYKKAGSHWSPSL